MKRLITKTLFVPILFGIAFGCSKTSDYITNLNDFSQLQGTIEGTLSTANSPYYVIGDLVIDSSRSLIIEAGVELHFVDSAKFVIKGEIKCIGDPTHQILFTSKSVLWKGIHLFNSSKDNRFRYTVIENVFIDEKDSIANGAMEVFHSNITIKNCLFRNNKLEQGGALMLDGAQAEITNNIFRENQAIVFGGAILSRESNTKTINNTFYNNSCLNYGGGLVLINPLSEDVQNNIFYQNSSKTGDPRISIQTGDSTHCNLDYNFLWYGNLNPEFVSEDNLHLQTNSPCINSGNPDSIYNDVDETRNDQGAYGGPLGDW